MNPTTLHADALRAGLVDELTERGYLTQSRWQAAFRTVPREVFVHRFAVPTPQGLVHHDVDEEPDAALAAVYSDTTLITQFDCGGTATSSSTSPSLMALMLEQLDPQPGETVLEIGAGTGYNAALLAHALGDDAVITVELHPQLVDNARRALAQAGYYPRVVIGDGANGAPDARSCDRLIATCGLDRIPAAWLRQVRPGGTILANVSFALVRLTVDTEGSATGRFGDPAAFMAMREDPADNTLTVAEILEATSGEGTVRVGAPLPHLDDPTVTFLRKLHLPELHQVIAHRTDCPVYHLYDPTHSSWSRATTIEQDSVVGLVEHGPRALWAELGQIVLAWEQHGQPTVDRYGLTVRPDGTHVLWIDDPGHHVTMLT